MGLLSTKARELVTFWGVLAGWAISQRGVLASNPSNDDPFAQLPKRIECAIAYQGLGFDLLNYDEYPTYFRDDSVMQLAQAGEYVGPDAIVEYAKFAAPNSAYLTTVVVREQKSRSGGYDFDTGLCIFDLAIRRRFELNYSTTNNDVEPFDTFSGAKLYYSLEENYIKRVNVWFPKGYVEFVFGQVLRSEGTYQFVCGVLANACSGIITDHDPNTCAADLEALPPTDAGGYVDGDSSGCRALHAVFAAQNPTLHCAHVSINAADADTVGAVKCSQSKFFPVEDLHSEEDLEFFYDLVRAAGVDPEVGYITPSPDVEEPFFLSGLFDSISQVCDVLFGGFF
jgi:hypothetical protein